MTEQELIQLAQTTTHTLDAIKEARRRLPSMRQDNFQSFCRLCSELGLNPVGFIDEVDGLNVAVHQVLKYKEQ